MVKCLHEPDYALPPHLHEVDGGLVWDDIKDKGVMPPNPDRWSQCRHCGAPLVTARDARMIVRRSWSIDKGFGDPLAASGRKDGQDGISS